MSEFLTEQQRLLAQVARTRVRMAIACPWVEVSDEGADLLESE